MRTFCRAVSSPCEYRIMVFRFHILYRLNTLYNTPQSILIHYRSPTWGPTEAVPMHPIGPQNRIFSQSELHTACFNSEPNLILRKLAGDIPHCSHNIILFTRRPSQIDGLSVIRRSLYVKIRTYTRGVSGPCGWRRMVLGFHVLEPQ